MNLIQLKDILKEFVLQQPIQSNVMFGSIYENLNSAERKYPIFNIDFESVNNNSNTLTYNIIVYYADRLTEDSSNVFDVKSDGITAIHLFEQKIKFVDGISVTEPVSINLFEQQFADICGGAWARIMITVPDNIDYCEVYESLSDYIGNNGQIIGGGSNSNVDLSNYATLSYVSTQIDSLRTLINNKQDHLTAGNNVTISDENVISAYGMTNTDLDNLWGDYRHNQI